MKKFYDNYVIISILFILPHFSIFFASPSEPLSDRCIWKRVRIARSYVFEIKSGINPAIVEGIDGHISNEFNGDYWLKVEKSMN